MRIRVLGSAAGGGFPQWNCNCSNCSRLRDGTFPGTARTQSSIAVSGNGRGWVLVNASPDIRAQLGNFAAMQPARTPRDTALAGVVLVDAQIDHTAGLLFLREGQRIAVHCTRSVHGDLAHGNPIFSVLEHFCGVEWKPIPLEQGETFSVDDTGPLVFEAVPLDGKAPPFSPNRENPQVGDNIGLLIRDVESGGSLFYAPGLAEVDPRVRAYLAEADCVLVDGTCWRDDELETAGVGTKRAREMGHLPQSGENGMLSLLNELEKPRKILIHINNTNPILDEDSPERAVLDQAGIEVAYDGMEIEL